MWFLSSGVFFLLPYSTSSCPRLSPVYQHIVVSFHTHFIYAFHPTSSLPVPSPQDWDGRRGAHEVSFGIPLGYPRQGI